MLEGILEFLLEGLVECAGSWMLELLLQLFIGLGNLLLFVPIVVCGVLSMWLSRQRSEELTALWQRYSIRRFYWLGYHATHRLLWGWLGWVAKADWCRAPLPETERPLSWSRRHKQHLRSLSNLSQYALAFLLMLPLLGLALWGVCTLGIFLL